MTELLKDESLAEKLIKKGFWLYLFSFLIAPSGYIISVIMSNDLGVEEVGIIYSIMSFMSLMSAYNDLGLTESLSYFLPKFRIKKQYNFVKTAMFMSLWFQMLTSMMLGMMMYLGADWLSMHYFHSPEASSMLKMFCLYFLGMNLFQVLSSMFMSFQDTFSLKLIEFAKMWSMVVFTMLVFLLWMGTLVNYSMGWIMWMILSMFMWMMVFLKKYMFTMTKGKLEYDKNMMSDYSKYSLWMFVWMNAWLILNQMDQQMIIYCLWPTEAWFYSNYSSLLMMSHMIMGPMLWLIFPLTSEIINKKQYNKLNLLFNFLYQYLSMFALSLGWLFLVLWPVIAITLFWTKFLISGVLLQYSAMFMMLTILMAVNFWMMAGMWKMKESVMIVMIAAIFNMLLNTMLMSNMWIMWAIISTMMCWMIMWLLSFKMIKSDMNIKLNLNFMLKNTMLMSILLIIIYNMKDNMFIYSNMNSYNNLLYLFMIWITMYLCMWIINLNDIKKLMNEVKNMVENKD